MTPTTALQALTPEQIINIAVGFLPEEETYPGHVADLVEGGHHLTLSGAEIVRLVRCASVAAPAPALDAPAVLPSEAVIGFAAWLTCRDEAVTFGSGEDAAPAAELTGQYWQAQGWDTPREDFAGRLKRMPVAARASQPATPAQDAAATVPDLRERLAEAHDASLDTDHHACRAILMEIIRLLDTIPPAAPQAVPLTDHHKLDNDQQVFFYEQDFYVLSNFSAFNLKFNGLTFPTSEHAYHYEKFAYERVGESVNDAFQRRNLAMSIKEAPSAHEAFKLAERWKGYRRADWDAVKVDIMREILRAKASQHEYVRRKLLETGDRELIEDSWRDDYWGWGPNRDGQNMLGKLWMEVRAELRAGIGTTATKEQSNG